MIHKCKNKQLFLFHKNMGNYKWLRERADGRRFPSNPMNCRTFSSGIGETFVNRINIF